MLINLVLLFLVFGASKKKLNVYAAAGILGLIKGILYFVVSRSLFSATLGFVAFAGMGVALFVMLARIDKKEGKEEPYSPYSSRKKMKFRWEYVVLSVIVFLMIFGESLIGLLIANGGS